MAGRGMVVDGGGGNRNGLLGKPLLFRPDALGEGVLHLVAAARHQHAAPFICSVVSSHCVRHRHARAVFHRRLQMRWRAAFIASRLLSTGHAARSSFPMPCTVLGRTGNRAETRRADLAHAQERHIAGRMPLGWDKQHRRATCERPGLARSMPWSPARQIVSAALGEV